MRVLGSNPWFKKARSRGDREKVGKEEGELGRRTHEVWSRAPGSEALEGEPGVERGAQSGRNAWNTLLWADRYCAPRNNSRPRGRKIGR